MIRNFVHKGLKKFFETGSTQGIIPTHERRLAVRLDAMNLATEFSDLNQPGWQLHELKGDRKGTWSIHVNGPWCLTFKFENKACHDVNYEQYH